MANGDGGGFSQAGGGAILGGALGLLGGILSSRDATRARRRQRRAIGEARTFADSVVKRVTEGELFSSAESFLTSTFRDAADSPLARDFAKGIRANQAVRGTFTGNLAGAQEAVGTSAFAQRLRQSLLPEALRFATAPEQLRQSVLGFEAPLRVAAATGGQLAGVGPPNLGSALGLGLSQGLQGAIGGFQAGRALDQTQLLRQALAQNQEGRGGPLIFDQDGQLDLSQFQGVI